jgi:hypothetical protein
MCGCCWLCIRQALRARQARDSTGQDVCESRLSQVVALGRFMLLARFCLRIGLWLREGLPPPIMKRVFGWLGGSTIFWVSGDSVLPGPSW